MQLKLGDKIRELRRKEGRTQEALADALGVTSQAVSRWESNGSYPDMEIIPSLANFFGISIDELFGYNNERLQKLNGLIDKITNMNSQNNGEDVCMDECIRLAREGVAEFPGNEKMMFCLASVLYNAGYVRYGENHLTDSEGYDVLNAERHSTYAEWKEAIRLYESVLPALSDSDLHNQAIVQLVQLYANTGEFGKAANVAMTAPNISSSREFLRLNTCDGKQKAAVYADTLITLIDKCSDLFVSCVIMNKNHLSPDESAEAVLNAIHLFDLLFTKGDYGIYHAKLSRLYLYLSEHLWRAGKHDEAFSSLNDSLEHAKKAEDIIRKGGESTYSSPFLRTVTAKIEPDPDAVIITLLPDDWPWWCNPDYSQVAKEMKSDPRWEAWVRKTQE